MGPQDERGKENPCRSYQPFGIGASPDACVNCRKSELSHSVSVLEVSYARRRIEQQVAAEKDAMYRAEAGIYRVNDVLGFRKNPANDRQVGGDHYKVGGEEHWDRVNRLGLDYFQGQITKYVERWKQKNGIEDLRKAQHFLEKYIELNTQEKGLEVRK